MGQINALKNIIKKITEQRASKMLERQKGIERRRKVETIILEVEAAIKRDPSTLDAERLINDRKLHYRGKIGADVTFEMYRTIMMVPLTTLFVEHKGKNIANISFCGFEMEPETEIDAFLPSDEREGNYEDMVEETDDEINHLLVRHFDDETADNAVERLYNTVTQSKAKSTTKLSTLNIATKATDLIAENKTRTDSRVANTNAYSGREM